VRLVESVLLEINERLGITMIITSHHIASTLRMAAWTVLLTERTALSGYPDELYKSDDRRIKRFFAEDGDLPT